MIYNNTLSPKQFLSTKVDQQIVDRHNISYPPSPPLSTSHMRSTKDTAHSDSWYQESTTRGEPKMLNLEKLIQNYAAHPELLELILSSKVEEDRRRAEEAKLRSKEIDYIIQKEDFFSASSKQHVPSPPVRPLSPACETTLPPISSKFYERRYSVSSSSSSESLPRINHQSFPSPGGWKNQQLANDFPIAQKRNSNIDMLLSPISSPSESKKTDFTLSKEYSTKYCQEENNKRPSYDAEPSNNKRRRRETQAITAIIETKEFPYNDDYLWKNNGNTVHKKSGFKSIYYKCTNSSKGCPVNKTVTFKDNGEHLIKYRGYHLPECNRIKRIIDVNK